MNGEEGAGGNFAYILLCADGSYYCGWTNDVAKRLAAMHGILSTATHFILKRYKEDGVPLIDAKKDGREMVI